MKWLQSLYSHQSVLINPNLTKLRCREMLSTTYVTTGALLKGDFLSFPSPSSISLISEVGAKPYLIFQIKNCIKFIISSISLHECFWFNPMNAAQFSVNVYCFVLFCFHLKKGVVIAILYTVLQTSWPDL